MEILLCKAMNNGSVEEDIGVGVLVKESDGIVKAIEGGVGAEEMKVETGMLMEVVTI